MSIWVKGQWQHGQCSLSHVFTPHAECDSPTINTLPTIDEYTNVPLRLIIDLNGQLYAKKDLIFEPLLSHFGGESPFGLVVYLL